MITEQGFVYRKDGKYLRTSERSAHTGRHHTVEWVDSLDTATVYGSNVLSRWIREASQGAEKLSVRVERSVSIL